MNTPLKIFIADDEAPARARLIALLQELQSHLPTQLIGEANNGRDALTLIEELQPDVVLLDIRMPAIDGLEVARHVARLKPHAPAVVFITAHDEFALEAFEVEAIDYLLKPVRASRLHDALLRVQKRLENAVVSPSELAESLARASAVANLKRKHLTVIERGKLLLVPVLDVIYFKAEMKYVTVRTREREYVIEEALNTLEQEFSDFFVRIHRNSLVAKQAIAGLEKSQNAEIPYRLLLRDLSDTLPVSRRQWPTIKNLIRSN